MKIPKDAKRVFKGVIFDVYQWPQEMFDGGTATFEMLKRPDTVVVIPVVGDKILIQTQQQPTHMVPFPSLPGGRAEEGEEPLSAAKREMLEETGYISDDWQLWKEYQPSSKTDWSVHFFIAKNCKYQQAPTLDAGEKITTRLISFEEFLLLADDPEFYETELVNFLLRLRLDSQKEQEFRKLLF